MIRFIVIFGVLVHLIGINLAKNVTELEFSDEIPTFENDTFAIPRYNSNWDDILDDLEEESMRISYTNNSSVCGYDGDCETEADYKEILGGDDFGIWDYRTDTDKRGTITKENVERFMEKQNNYDDRLICRKCKCGLRFKRRVVNGSLAKRNEFPWMVLFRVNGQFYCGGSLISSRHVLTAAHCVFGVAARRMSVVIRLINRIQPGRNSIIRRIKMVFRHRRYNPSNLNRDIAILQMSKSVRLGGPVLRTVCLPKRSLRMGNRIAIATGWGRLSETGIAPKRLRKVVVRTFTTRRCQRQTNYGSQITRFMICAGYIRGGKDTCSGDSGGPLHIFSNGQLVQIGITSWGNGCARPNYPGVYTKVKYFLRFIRRLTRNACKCRR